MNFDAPLSGSDQGWNSDVLALKYFRNSETQRGNAFGWILKCYPPSEFAHRAVHIIDYGCGDGKISAMLAQMILPSNGTVTAVDISEHLLKIAQSRFQSQTLYPNLKFIHEDSSVAENISNSELIPLADVITMSMVGHLLQDPLQTLKNLRRKLKPNGKFIAILPLSPCVEMKQAMQEQLEHFNVHRNSRPSGHRTLLNESECQEILTEAGFHRIATIQESTLNSFVNVDDFVDWCVGTLTANWNIPLSQSVPLFESIAKRFIELKPSSILSTGAMQIEDTLLKVYGEAGDD
uniref:Methyltransferase domain-containing protein n=1 Tax=Timspurckia oligopyrenoides TaxID=708627 RepID=A0A6T6M024_9RHOD